MDEEYLVYEQDEVYTLPTCEEELTVGGKLRIVERKHGVVIEWRCGEDETNGDSDWAVINSAAVSFTHHNISDSVEISTPRRNVRPINIELIDLRSYKIGKEASLVLIQRDGTTHTALSFKSGSISCFVDVLKRYRSIKRSEKDSALYLVLDKKQANNDDQLSAMNLVPSRKGPSGSNWHPSGEDEGAGVKGGGFGRGGAVLPHQSTHHRVWGFFNNMKRDPYTTTLTTLSKFYDVVLYDGAEGYVHDGGRGEEDVAELFHSLNGFEDLEPGYEVLTKKGNLIERPDMERLAPLTHDDFQSYVDDDGRILQADQQALQERIFKGGIHPTLRRELWCFLLGHYEWNATHAQREERRHSRENLYFIMKQQWKTITPDQEMRFTAFRDRRSLIEKDVNRTDRNHPFYEGEHNPNVDLLHDVLMTYVMYNFDLGYVQGMSDLLAPILYVTQNEATAFWCFVGYMDIVYRNFDMDQSGMKQQLKDLQMIVQVVDPELMSYLEARDSANFYFCFRWLLVRYKRELNYTNTLRLWEVMWTGQPCPNFHLLFACALLDTEKNTIMENKFGFTEILKHINDISLRIDLESTLRKAEAIYYQLERSPSVPNTVRKVIGLPLIDEPEIPQKQEALLNEETLQTASSNSDSEDYGAVSIYGAVSSLIGSAVKHISGDDLYDVSLQGAVEDNKEAEKCFETAISGSFI